MTRLALVLLLLVLAAEVRAEGAKKKVLVVTPSAASKQDEATAQRLNAELTASGFEVQLRTFAGGSLREMLDAAAVDPDAAATVTLASRTAKRATGELSVDVWIADRSGGKTVGRRVDGSTPEQLSVRVAEALRAGLIDVTAADEPELLPVRERVIATTLVPGPSQESSLPPTGDLRISSGGALMIGGDSLSSAVGPHFRVSTRVFPDLWLGVQLVAPLWGAEQQDTLVSQAMFNGELTWLTSFADRLRLSPTVGAGWYWLGRKREGAVGPDNDYALLTSLGVGVALNLSDTAYVLWDVQSLLFVPRVVVELGNRGEARPGLPAFISTLGLNVHL
ncbi:MAG: hypothetical protein RJA70_2723 [Pseudomonadota bacterium]|jgi:hypothetical protein